MAGIDTWSRGYKVPSNTAPGFGKDIEMRFARWVFRVAGLYGILVVAPMLFMERLISARSGRAAASRGLASVIRGRPSRGLRGSSGSLEGNHEPQECPFR